MDFAPVTPAFPEVGIILLTSILKNHRSLMTAMLDTLPIWIMISMTIVTKNMKDVKMAKPFLWRVASRSSDFVIVVTVEPEKAEAVGETWCTPVEVWGWECRTAL